MTKTAEQLENMMAKLTAELRKWHKWGVALAIFFGFGAFYMEWRLHSHITQVESSVSTRYIGQWPDHFPFVTGLISRAQGEDEMLVLTDFVGNWMYTVPDKYYEKYYDGILGKIADPHSAVKVKMLVFDRASAIDRISKQFFEDHFVQRIDNDDWAYSEDGGQAEESFATYEAYRSFYVEKGFIPKAPRPSSFAGFLNEVLQIQDQFCQRLSIHTSQVEIRTLANQGLEKNESKLDKYVYFYWMNRGREMVLSFRRYNSINVGYAFYTTDTAFLTEFESQFMDRWNEASDQNRIKGPYCYSDGNHPLKVTIENHKIRYE